MRQAHVHGGVPWRVREVKLLKCRRHVDACGLFRCGKTAGDLAVCYPHIIGDIAVGGGGAAAVLFRAAFPLPLAFEPIVDKGRALADSPFSDLPKKLGILARSDTPTC